MPSLLVNKRPVQSLYGADILGAEWMPRLQDAEFAGAEFTGAEFGRCQGVRYSSNQLVLNHHEHLKKFKLGYPWPHKWG